MHSLSYMYVGVLIMPYKYFEFIIMYIVLLRLL